MKKRLLLFSVFALTILLLFVIIRSFDENDVKTLAYPRERVPKDIEFEDVHPEEIEYDPVHETVELGYMEGYSPDSFGAKDRVTRGQFAQVLYNGYSQNFLGTNTQYRDISDDSWCAAAVAWVNHYGLMDGYSAESFAPDLPLTWEQLITALHRAAGEPKGTERLQYLEDYDEISANARKAYGWALNHDLVQIAGNRLGPRRELTRGELATIMPKYNQLLDELNYEEPKMELPEIGEFSAQDLFSAVKEDEPFNNELQKYDPAQVQFVENKVVMTAENPYKGKYLSGCVKSNISVRYGTYEIELNNLSGQGYWPAIWMLPDSTHTRFPELDIYEMVGGKPGELHGTLHTLNTDCSSTEEYSSETFQYNYPGNTLPATTRIRLEWSPSALVWWINGEEVKRITENVPDNYMYIIMNLAIGGNWAGVPNQETLFPVAFTPKITEFSPVELRYRES